MKIRSTYNTFTFSLVTGVLLLGACKKQESIHPQRRDIVDAVFASGHIENNNQYYVNANTDGYLKTAYVTEGDSVKTGQQLFRLTNEVQAAQVATAGNNLEYAKTNTSPRSPQMEQLKIQINQARDKAALDSLNYQRYSRLVKTHAVSEADFDNVQLAWQASVSSLRVLQKNLADLQRNVDLNLKNARAQYEVQQQSNNYYSISARAAGTLVSIVKKTGDYVKKGDALALIGSGKAIAKLYIAEDDIEHVKTGQQVLISLNSLKNTVIKGSIAKIYPAFNSTEQSFVADAIFTEDPGLLLNATQLQANIIITQKKQVLVIPTLYLTGNNEVVLKNNNEKKVVQTGIRTLEWTEITGGLTESDELILPKLQP